MRRDLLHPKEAAMLLAVSQKTLRRWDAEGKIRTVRNGPTGHRQARRIVLRAESVGAAVAQIDGMVLDSRRSIKEYSALSRKLNGRSSGDGPAA